MKRILFPILVLFGSTSLWAQTTNYAAHSLFVVSFAKYASWPASDGDFKIAVIGKSKVYEEMVKITANKTVDGKPYKIVQVESLPEALDAHIIFLPDNKSSLIDELTKATEGKPVMIITEREGLHKKGAGFSFVVLDNKLRFDVNNAELEKRNIKMSSNLLNLANTTL
jgi:hypothetical protein